jgi:hypothetical protein
VLLAVAVVTVVRHVHTSTQSPAIAESSQCWQHSLRAELVANRLLKKMEKASGAFAKDIDLLVLGSSSGRVR